MKDERQRSDEFSSPRPQTCGGVKPPLQRQRPARPQTPQGEYPCHRPQAEELKNNSALPPQLAIGMRAWVQGMMVPGRTLQSIPRCQVFLREVHAVQEVLEPRFGF